MGACPLVLKPFTPAAFLEFNFLFSNPDFFNMVRRLIRSVEIRDELVDDDDSAHVLCQVKKLTALLASRLSRNLEERLQGLEAKQQHWVW